jgi:anthranilate/para-aminobenzoate synthase component I
MCDVENAKNLVLATVRAFSAKFGEDAVCVFARRKGLAGYEWPEAHARFAVAKKFPVEEESAGEIEIRVLGGISREWITHSLCEAERVLAMPLEQGKGRVFLFPSFFPWETTTQVPIIVREAWEEKRFVFSVEDWPAKPSRSEAFLFDAEESGRIVKAIERIVQKMRDGQCYLMNYTTRVSIERPLEKFSAEHFVRRWLENPSRFGAFLKSGVNGVMAFSPERFVAVRDGYVLTEPIKGTVVSADGGVPDLLCAKTLWANEKEICEHTMVVDLLRNDLNAVCEPGSVGVWNPFFAGIAGFLVQMQSTIFGKLKKGVNAGSLLRAVLPAGSVTGTPKWRVCEFTGDLEKERRGYYTGVCGFCEANGGMDSMIVIRSLCLENNALSAGVGAGITTLSEPEAELREFETKLSSFWGRLA